MSLQSLIDVILNLHPIPVLVTFTICFIGIGLRYLKYKKVTDQFVSSFEVRKKIDSGERLLVYIIDPFTCSSCIDNFQAVKKIVEDHGLSFLLVSSRERQNYIDWGPVPALIAYEKGVPIKRLDSSKQIRKLNLEQYRKFVSEVSKIWKIA
jgi:hypothetical protein